MKALSFIKKALEPIIMAGKAHDRDAADYDEKHVEIYNPTEQRRIQHVLKGAFNHIRTASAVPRMLDFGAGTGNLTEHLLGLGGNVVAADVSSKYLERLRLKMVDGSLERLETLLLNGEDLSGIANDSIDMVATYSVLHHVPDYLKIVDEFVRVLKAGGIIYIDHEVCPSYWELNSLYQAYLDELGSEFSNGHLKELGISLPDNELEINPKHDKQRFFQTWLKQSKGRTSSRKRRRIPKGGDIHVYNDDHIVWGEIESRLHPRCEVIENVDYLVCRERDAIPEVWGKWKDKCADMRMIVACKT